VADIARAIEAAEAGEGIPIDFAVRADLICGITLGIEIFAVDLLDSF
jgi:hypothetical protein